MELFTLEECQELQSNMLKALLAPMSRKGGQVFLLDI